MVCQNIACYLTFKCRIKNSAEKCAIHRYYLNGESVFQFKPDELETITKKSMKDAETLRTHAIALFAEGHIWTALEICRNNNFDDLLTNFNSSVQLLYDIEAYKTHYQKDNERIPGAQQFPDSRQLLAMSKVAKLSPKCMLDIGCADGSFAFFCLQDKAVPKVIGIDPWVEGINYANNKSFESDYDTIFIQGVVEDINVQTLNYDVVHLGEVLEHVINPSAILKSIYRENVRIVTTVPISRPQLSQKEIEITISGDPAEHVRVYTEESLDELFSEVNMKPLSHDITGSSSFNGKPVGWVNLVSVYK